MKKSGFIKKIGTTIFSKFKSLRARKVNYQQVNFSKVPVWKKMAEKKSKNWEVYGLRNKHAS